MDLEPVAVDPLDADLVEARDRLADPASLAVGYDRPNRCKLGERAQEGHERRRVDAVVVGDEQVAHVLVSIGSVFARTAA